MCCSRCNNALLCVRTWSFALNRDTTDTRQSNRIVLGEIYRFLHLCWFHLAHSNHMHMWVFTFWMRVWWPSRSIGRSFRLCTHCTHTFMYTSRKMLKLIYLPFADTAYAYACNWHSVRFTGSGSLFRRSCILRSFAQAWTWCVRHWMNTMRRRHTKCVVCVRVGVFGCVYTGIRQLHTSVGIHIGFVYTTRVLARN